ncbi:MAG: tyrosine--tRNA ligase [Elusimicrobia bacterium]|nr:tyrosine--tRNA ligase [Elusimicrobiota bacterium]
MESTFAMLSRKGYVAQVSDPGLADALATSRLVCYCGFDPTAKSLHLGHLVPLMILARLQRAGQAPIALVGGATGMIGDPSGKSKERQLLSREAVAANVESMRRQFQRFLSFEGSDAALLLDNNDWIAGWSYTDWLREIGKHFSVSSMLAKESVRRRMDDRDQGISYTEFSYMLIQAYDFLHLSDKHGCSLQVGGDDQWGNITAGIELVRRLRSKTVYGLTSPLMLDSAGQKFGKTEDGVVWLDPEMTSPYRFYQYFINVDDRDVVRYLHLLTWLGDDEITRLAETVEGAPEARAAQAALAYEATKLVHGGKAADDAVQATRVAFSEDIRTVSLDAFEAIFAGIPSASLPMSSLDDGIPLAKVLVSAGIAPSNNEARRLLAGKGIYLNNRQIADNRVVKKTDLLFGRLILVRKGKKDNYLVRFTEKRAGSRAGP